MNYRKLSKLLEEVVKTSKLETPKLLPKIIEVEPKVVRTTYVKPWRSAWSNPQNVRFNTATSVELQGKPTQYFEMVKDVEPRNVSVHFKTTGRKGHSTITDAEKQTLFTGLNEIIPEGSHVSTYGYVSPGGVHGLSRLAAENGYVKVGTRMVKDKAGNPLEIPIFEKPISRITAENAAKITPEQWTAAQDAAIVNGDMAEALRLRDLHALAKGNYIKFYHGTDDARKFNNAIDLNKTKQGSFFGSDSKDVAYTYKGEDIPPLREMTINGNEEFLTADYKWSNHIEDLAKEGFIITPKQISDFYSGKPVTLFKDPNWVDPPKSKLFEFYGYPINPLYIENPTKVDWREVPFRGRETTTNYIGQISGSEGHDFTIIPNVVDMGIYTKPGELPKSIPATDILVHDPKRVKLADAVTYDDAGKRIPLGERDNFNINDLRYILGLPLVSSIF